MDIIIYIPEDVVKVLSSTETNKQKTERLKLIDYSGYQIKYYLKVWKEKSITKDSKPSTQLETAEEVKVKSEFKNDKGNVEVNSLTVTTVEQALEVANIDLDVWELDRSIVNSWGSTMKINDVPVYRTNYQVKLTLKTKVKHTIEEVFEEFHKKLPINNTVYPKLPIKPKANIMLECGLVDHHFGMLAWSKETLTDYDLKIAEILYVESVKKAIERAGGIDKIARFLIPLGHDFFHINDQKNETPRAGHRLDVDGRVPKVYSTGKKAVINVINYLINIAPVEIVYVAGNHDPQMSYFLCDSIASWFRECNDVIVDMDQDIVNPTARKYRRWGKGLLGMSHGLDEKMADLPLIMANEVPQLWADSIYREVHIGHYHKSQSYGFRPKSNTFTPVIVRTLPSLCGSDDYSYSHGWLSAGVQAAEFYLWDKEFGQVGNIIVKAEEII